LEPATDSLSNDGSTITSSGLWRRFCQLVVKVFYRRVETLGEVTLPQRGGIIFCANHINALLDPVIIQATTPLALRPLARSGLFKFPLSILLNLIGAIPIYRARPGRDVAASNRHTFSKCYEMLGKNQCIMIFPEGQSHSDPHLHSLKTGAARLAVSSIEANGHCTVIPIGLTFTQKGRFRSSVLVHFGEPIDLSHKEDLKPKAVINLVNQRITEGLVSVTLNANSWEDIELVNRLERFFSLRHGKYRTRNLSQRFKALQRLIEGQKLLQAHEPKRVRALISQLKGFERMCRCLGIKDYHLTVHYRPLLIASYLVRISIVLCLALPVALFGIVNSIVPYQLTKLIAPRLAKADDQLDTAKILVGSFFLLLFWGVQSYLVYSYFGIQWMLVYMLAVVASSCVSVAMRHEYGRILNNLKVFFVFMRKKQVRGYIEHKRQQLEVELAQLVRIAKRLTAAGDSSAQQHDR